MWSLLDHSIPNRRSLAEREYYLPIYRIVAPAAVRVTLRLNPGPPGPFKMFSHVP